MIFRTCTKCGELKPETSEFFPKHKKGVDGLAAECKGCLKARKAVYGLSPHNRPRLLKRTYDTTDAKRGRRNDLTIEYVAAMCEQPCTYCGTVERLRGLDRIDNSMGHTMANTVPCCTRCNVTRMDNFTHAEFKLFGPLLTQIDKARK